MPRFAHADLLDNGPAYLKANCNKVILIDAYSDVYATINTTAKVGETALVTGDFAIAGAANAPRILTATLTGKSAGNALKTVANGTNMHFAFVDTVNSKVLLVTEESTDQSITSGNPLVINSNGTYSIPQPTA